MTHNLGTDTQSMIVGGASKASRTVWITKSEDDGATWSKPADITRDVKKPDWTWYATGPGVGIQTKSGRLVIPCDNQVQGTKAQQSHVIYSDHGGNSWQIGGIVGPKCNESQIVELNSGNLLLNIRSYRGNHCRLTALSKDGGVTFAPPVEDQILIEPVCQASIIRYPTQPGCLIFLIPPASSARS